LAYVVETRHVSARLASGDDTLGDLASFGGIKLSTTAANSTLCTGRRDPAEVLSRIMSDFKGRRFQCRILLGRHAADRQT